MNKAVLLSPALLAFFASCGPSNDGYTYKEDLSRASYTSVQKCEKDWGKSSCKNERGVVYSPYFMGSMGSGTSTSSTSSKRPTLYYPYTSSGTVSESFKRAPVSASGVYNSTSSARVSTSSVTRVAAPSVSRGGFGGVSASSSS